MIYVSDSLFSLPALVPMYITVICYICEKVSVKSPSELGSRLENEFECLVGRAHEEPDQKRL